jgi:hypothetical protein
VRQTKKEEEFWKFRKGLTEEGMATGQNCEKNIT